MPGEIPMSSLEEIITHRIGAPVDSSTGDERSNLVRYAIEGRRDDPGQCRPVSSLVEPFSHRKEGRVSLLRASRIPQGAGKKSVEADRGPLPGKVALDRGGRGHFFKAIGPVEGVEGFLLGGELGFGDRRQVFKGKLHREFQGTRDARRRGILARGDGSGVVDTFPFARVVSTAL